MGSPFLTDPTPEQFREQNDQVLTAISHWHHRAFGFVYLSPAHEQEKSGRSGSLCKRWSDGRNQVVGCSSVQRGVRGFHCSPAIELKAVIYQHTWLKTTGNLEGESTPADLVVLAETAS